MVRAVFKSKFCAFVMSRGLGKSWLSMLIVVIYCLLYPNSLAAVVSGSFRQSKTVIREKYKENLCRMSPFIQQEEKSYKCSVQVAEIEFWNGSKIQGLPLGDGSKLRGLRLNFLFVDEAFTVPKIIYETVLKPMTVVKANYVVGQDNSESNNKILLASTASYRANWLYGVYVEWTKKMLSGDKDFFTMTLPYTVGVRVGLYDEKIVEDAKATMAEAEFEQEYLGRFSKLIDGSWIKYDDLMECADLTTIETTGFSNYEYIMSIDVARISGEDNTVMMIFKMLPRADRIELELVYIRALNGCSFSEQADNVRELLRKFPNVIRIFMDVMTIGQGLADELAKDYYYEPEEKWYLPLIDMNDEIAMKNIETTHGVPIIYGIKANPEINHKMGYAIKNYTEKRWLHMYSIDAGDDIQTKKHGAKDLTLEEQLLVKQSEATRIEILNMEAVGMNSGWMKFTTKSKRKDRWSAICMGIYGATLIKKERDEEEECGEALFGVSYMNRR